MQLTDEQRQIATDNHGLIGKYLNDHKSTMEYEDWYDILAIGLCQAARSYNPERGAFSTFAYKCMSIEVAKIQRYNNKNRQRFQENILYFNSCIDENGEYCGDYLENQAPRCNSVENKVLSEYILNEYLRDKRASSQVRKILDLSSRGYTQQEIADMIGCTRANISRVKKEFEAYIKTGAVSGRGEQKKKKNSIADVLAEIQDTWRELKCVAV